VADAAPAGTIRILGEDVTAWPRGRLRTLRRHVAMLFQDPQSSLDPRHSVGSSIGEPIRVHRLRDNAAARRARVHELPAAIPASAARFVRTRNLDHQRGGGIFSLSRSERS